MRFESLEEAQTYLDHWEERWADTRIHGTTKRQVAAMFAEEKPALLPLPARAFPLLPIRRAHGASGWLRGSRSGLLRRAAGLDRPARPGAVGCSARSACWTRRPASCCASTCARRAAAIASKTRTAPSKHRWARMQLLCRADKAGAQIGALCRGMHERARRDRGAPHSGRAVAGQEVRRRQRRGCLRRRPGSGRPASTASCAATWSGTRNCR